jgi:hypothetical protein
VVLESEGRRTETGYSVAVGALVLVWRALEVARVNILVASLAGGRADLENSVPALGLMATLTLYFRVLAH